MSEAKPVKILTVGAALGAFVDLFAKIKAIDAKHGKFDFALCVGDFFGPPEDTDNEQLAQLLAGHLDVPLECYVMQGRYPLPETVVAKYSTTGGELCKNVFLMSKSAVVTTANGIRVACLGGTYDDEAYHTAVVPPGFLSPYFSRPTVERLLSNSIPSGPESYKSLAAIQSNNSTSQLVDILVTYAVPASITQQSAISPVTNLVPSAPPLDDIVQHIQPRYHFAAAGEPACFWEREPFAWDDASGRVSRFVNLGAFHGPPPTTGKKQRWFYAFSLTPGAAVPRLMNATANPFVPRIGRAPKRQRETEGENFIFGNVRQPEKRSRVAADENGKPPPGYKCHRCDSTEHLIDNCPERTKPPEGYICKICNIPGHLVRDCPTRFAIGDTGGRKPKPGYVCRACGSEDHYLDDCPVANQQPARGERRAGRRGPPPKEIAPDECWFCLSNPNLAKHLIVAIGSECYVTLPKGQIIPTRDSSPSDVPGGGHVLIVPITHYPTFHTIPPELSEPIIKETNQFKSALRAMYAKHGDVAVMFEIARLSSKGGHAHVQVVPVSRGLADQVEEAFIKEGRMVGVDFEADADAALESCAGGMGGYFRVDLPDGRKMVHLLKDHVPFSIQFGRQVLCALLNIPERMDWKACTLPEEDDKADTADFKKAFAPFNTVQ
ncbi:nuclear protein [Fistulina hepatica ATCC 64428]|uniref:Nuclear protein n=1 Tax=Fistulina hepatica ATCC 64428 TaxID=1128425 RepID=A0A0D7A5P5_9AGAR|nr:nuclear protein [Fistulina hepatica ATCC 64428]